MSEKSDIFTNFPVKLLKFYPVSIDCNFTLIFLDIR